MAWTSPLTWVAGQIVTAAQLNTHLRDNLNDLADGSWGRDMQAVRKSADENVTNSATMQSDDHLLFTASANSTYLVEVGLLVVVSGGSSTSDIKTGWSLPAASPGWTGGGYGADIALTGSSGTAEFLGQVGAAAATISYGLFNSGTTFILHKSTIQVAGTAGTCNFQWAQNTAVAGITTTVKAGSWLRAERVA